MYPFCGSLCLPLFRQPNPLLCSLRSPQSRQDQDYGPDDLHSICLDSFRYLEGEYGQESSQLPSLVTLTLSFALLTAAAAGFRIRHCKNSILLCDPSRRLPNVSEDNNRHLVFLLQLDNSKKLPNQEELLLPLQGLLHVLAVCETDFMPCLHLRSRRQ